MRIEIIGLPGVGKTTLAKAVCSDKRLLRKKSWLLMDEDDVLFDWYKLLGNTGNPMALNSLIHLSSLPFIGKELKLKMIRKIRTCLYDQMNELNDHFNPCSDFFIQALSSSEEGTPLHKVHGIWEVERAIIVSRIAEQFFRNKFVLLDEGPGVRVNTLARFNVSIKRIKQYCEVIPEPDGYIIVNLEDVAEQNQRLTERGDNDAFRSYLNTHTERMQAGLDCLIDIIHKKNIPFINVDAQDSIKTNARIVKQFTQKLLSNKDNNLDLA